MTYDFRFRRRETTNYGWEMWTSPTVACPVKWRMTCSLATKNASLPGGGLGCGAKPVHCPRSSQC